MSRRIYRTWQNAGSFFLLAMCVPLLIAGVGAAEAAWEWDASLSAVIEYNDNVDLLPDESVLVEDIYERFPDEERRQEALDALGEISRDDTIYIVSPLVGLSWSEQDDSFGLEYRPEYRDYTESRRKDTWVHFLDASLEWRRLKPFRLSVTDTLDVTPRDLVTTEEDLRTQIQHNYLVARPSFFWEFSPTASLELAYIEERDDFSGDSILDLPEDDIARHLGEVKAVRRWSPRWENTLRVTGGAADRNIGEDYDLIEAGIGGFHNISRRTDLSYEVALHNRWYEVSEDKLSWIAEALWSWRHHDEGRFELSFDRALEDRFDGDTVMTTRGEAAEIWEFHRGSSLSAGVYYEYRDYKYVERTDETWEPYVRTHLVATSWLAFEVEGGYRTSHVEEVPFLPEEAPAAEISDDDRIRARAAVIVTPWRHLSVEAAYHFVNNSSGVPRDEYEQNIFHLLLTVLR